MNLKMKYITLASVLLLKILIKYGHCENENVFEDSSSDKGSAEEKALNEENMEYDLKVAPQNISSSPVSDSQPNTHTNKYSFLNYVYSNIKRSNDCENPELEYLENLLSEYQVLYRKYEENVLKTKIESYYVEPQTSKSQTIHRDQSQCNTLDRNMTTINQQSLCPWKYVVSVRHDRFPPYRTEVRCTCDSCTTYDKNFPLPKAKYSCQPVLKPMLVLIKGECGSDGYYNWKPTTEEVNVACVCIHNHQHIHHL